MYLGNFRSKLFHWLKTDYVCCIKFIHLRIRCVCAAHLDAVRPTDGPGGPSGVPYHSLYVRSIIITIFCTSTRAIPASANLELTAKTMRPR